MEAARSIREDFLHQDAFHEVDTYTPLFKQYLMMKLMMEYYDRSMQALSAGVSIEELVKLVLLGRYLSILAVLSTLLYNYWKAHPRLWPPP